MTDLKRYLNLKNVSIVVYLNGGIMSNRANRRAARSKKGGQYRGLRKLSTESDFHMREKKKK